MTALQRGTDCFPGVLQTLVENLGPLVGMKISTNYKQMTAPVPHLWLWASRHLSQIMLLPCRAAPHSLAVLVVLGLATNDTGLHNPDPRLFRRTSPTVIYQDPDHVVQSQVEKKNGIRHSRMEEGVLGSLMIVVLSLLYFVL